MLPETYEWVPMRWTPALLTKVVLAAYPELESAVCGGVLPWIEEEQTPTRALSDANKLSESFRKQRELVAEVQNDLAKKRLSLFLLGISGFPHFVDSVQERAFYEVNVESVSGK